MVYAAAAVAELLIEPLWIVGQRWLYIRLKVVVEGSALAVKCGVTIGLLVWFPELGLAVFCYAQVPELIALHILFLLEKNKEAELGGFHTMKLIFTKLTVVQPHRSRTPR